MSQIDAILTLIAQKHLGIETLQTRNSDSLASTTAVVHRDALEAPSRRASNLAHRA